MQHETPNKTLYQIPIDMVIELGVLKESLERISEILDTSDSIDILTGLYQRDHDRPIKAFIVLDRVFEELNLEPYMEFVLHRSRGSNRPRTHHPMDGEHEYLNHDNGEIEIPHKDLSNVLDEADIDLLLNYNHLFIIDPDEELLRNIITEAFLATPLFPEDYWEIDEELIKGMKDDLKTKIMVLADTVDNDRDYPAYKEIRKLVLEYMELI